jgi:hypothetical protein
MLSSPAPTQPVTPPRLDLYRALWVNVYAAVISPSLNPSRERGAAIMPTRARGHLRFSDGLE